MCPFEHVSMRLCWTVRFRGVRQAATITGYHRSFLAALKAAAAAGIVSAPAPCVRPDCPLREVERDAVRRHDLMFTCSPARMMALQHVHARAIGGCPCCSNRRFSASARRAAWDLSW